jgi:hypothetical protein
LYLPVPPIKYLNILRPGKFFTKAPSAELPTPRNSVIKHVSQKFRFSIQNGHFLGGVQSSSYSWPNYSVAPRPTGCAKKCISRRLYRDTPPDSLDPIGRSPGCQKSVSQRPPGEPGRHIFDISKNGGPPQFPECSSRT